MRVLLVEDDKLAQMAGKCAVKEVGYDVEVASTVIEAITAADNSKYDLILMDIGLDEAERDGFDVATEIRKGSGPNKLTPIIAVTAHNEESYRNRAKEVGMNGFLNKPLNANKLKGALEEL